LSQQNMHVTYCHHCHKMSEQRKNEKNLQCTTIGPRFGGKWYNLFKISRTAKVSFGTPWSGHSGYWICKTDNGVSSTCNNINQKLIWPKLFTSWWWKDTLSPFQNKNKKLTMTFFFFR
jgi:hypothetical protein